MNPLVSVIIPAYNAEQYIAEALESVVAQTYHHYEIIVVDDGSTDDTRGVLQPYIDQGVISYCYCSNSGPATARNAGIQMARGDLVGFLDADDTWLPSKLEVQVAYLQDHQDVAFVSADMSQVRDRVVVADSCFMQNGYEYIASGLIYENLLRENFIFTPMVLVRKSVLALVGFFDEELRISEDRDLWLRIARDHHVAILDRVLGGRRLHGSNTTGNRELYAWHQIRMFEKQLSQWADVQSERAGVIRGMLRGILRDRYYELGAAYLRKASMPDARSAFCSSLRYSGADAFRPRMLLALLPEFLIGWLIDVKARFDMARGGDHV